MQTLKINRQKLISRMKENRDKHEAEFNQAMEDRHAAVVKRLKQELEAAESGRQAPEMIRFPKPENHTEDYDRVIDMLGFTNETDIEMTELEFAQYARDEWRWKHEFNAVSTQYADAREGR